MREIIHIQVIKRLMVFLIINILCAYVLLNAQSDEDCIMCHEDSELTTIRNGEKVSLYVDTNLLNKYVHEDVKCAECHKEAAADLDYLHSDGKLMLL